MAFVGAQVAEAAAALLAAVGRGPAVDPLVGVQVAQFLEAAAALGTSVGALACMHPLVSLEPREDGEALPTLGAGEGALGPAVDQPVALEPGGMAEALSALGAGKGLLPGVDALVLPQVAQVVEPAAAVPALVASLHLGLLPRQVARGSSLLGAGPTPTLRPRSGGGARGGQALEGVGLGRVQVDQLEVLLEEGAVRTEGPAQ